MSQSELAVKSAGYRLTSPRRHIFAAIQTTPMTIQEISQSLHNSHVKHDLTTLYRTLELFVSLNLVTKIQFGDHAARYEKAHDHHHHLVCDTCGKIEDIPVTEDALFKEISEKTNFHVTRHSLEFFGFCNNCQTS